MQELFDKKGCLRQTGLQALVDGRLDELNRLEAAEHLSFCDRCLERYTALLTPDVLEQPAHSVASPVIRTVWVRMMQSTAGRGAIAAVAAALALTFWASGVFQLPQALREQRQQELPSTAAAAVQPPAANPLRDVLNTCSDLFGGRIAFNLDLNLFPTDGGQK